MEKLSVFLWLLNFRKIFIVKHMISSVKKIVRSFIDLSNMNEPEKFRFRYISFSPTHCDQEAYTHKCVSTKFIVYDAVEQVKYANRIILNKESIWILVFVILLCALSTLFLCMLYG